MEIIKQGEIVTSAWVHLGDDQPLPATTDVTVSLARLLGERTALRARRDGRTGVRLRPADEIEALLPELAWLPLVAIEFPKFTDGRGYSQARLLRDRHGYQGELRAVGNVLRDQLFYMHRCGFDAFELQAGKSVRDALDAFRELSVRYQAAADDPRPLFRRRAALP